MPSGKKNKPSTKPTKATVSKRPAKPASPNRRATSKASKPGTVGLTIDAALKKRWERSLAVVDSAKQRGMSAFDELWEEVAHIAGSDPPLYLAAGCATFQAFLDRFLHEDERTAKRNMRVARFASPNDEEEFGVSKIDAALSYLEAKTGSALEGRLPVAFDKLKIPIVEGGTKKSIAFADASVQQLAAATRELRGDTGNSNESPIVKALRKALAVDGLRTVGVRYAGGRISLTAIETGVVAKLGKALRGVRLPEV